jgi:hypothetical protein
MELFISYALLGLRLALAVLLYIFLGWSLLTLWHALQKQSEGSGAKKAPPISLQFEREVRQFTQAQVYIGREAGCEFIIQDETVSSRHARISRRNNQWWLEDTHSKNGTFLNGAQLSSATVLADQDEIRCGQVVLKVSIDSI